MIRLPLYHTLCWSSASVLTTNSLPVFISVSGLPLSNLPSSIPVRLGFHAALLHGIGDLSAAPARLQCMSFFILPSPTRENIRRRRISALDHSVLLAPMLPSVLRGAALCRCHLLADQMTDLCRQCGVMSQMTCLRGGDPLPVFWAPSTVLWLRYAAAGH